MKQQKLEGETIHPNYRFEGRSVVWINSMECYWRSTNDTRTRRGSSWCDEWGLNHLSGQRVNKEAAWVEEWRSGEYGQCDLIRNGGS
jgi:hypothetical protein